MHEAQQVFISCEAQGVTHLGIEGVGAADPDGTVALQVQAVEQVHDGSACRQPLLDDRHLFGAFDQPHGRHDGHGRRQLLATIALGILMTPRTRCLDQDLGQRRPGLPLDGDEAPRFHAAVIRRTHGQFEGRLQLGGRRRRLMQRPGREAPFQRLNGHLADFGQIDRLAHRFSSGRAARLRSSGTPGRRHTAPADARTVRSHVHRPLRTALSR